jgi:hypothetical protein
MIGRKTTVIAVPTMIAAVLKPRPMEASHLSGPAFCGATGPAKTGDAAGA